MSDLRSRSNINLIPRYADARHLEDEDNIVQFQNKGEKKGENGMSDLTKRRKNGT